MYKYHKHQETLEQQLFIEDTAVAAIAAAVGTPCYIYSQAYIIQQVKAYQEAFKDIKHQIHYAVKANSNLEILKVIGNLGAGFDVVSQGEMQQILQAKHNLHTTVFSGVGKTSTEIAFALQHGIQCFNVESEPELLRIATISKQFGKTAQIAFRVNPNINPNTHPYIATGINSSKFGLAAADVVRLSKLSGTLSNISITGLSFHLGSQILEIRPFTEAFRQILELRSQLQSLGVGISIENINIGGGLGVVYTNENPPTINEYAATIKEVLSSVNANANYNSTGNLTIHIEPGRSIMANAGMLISQVEYVKHTPSKNFVILDAGMNNLLRPALYGAEHEIIPVALQGGGTDATDNKIYDIVGPICESSDVFKTDTQFAVAPQEGQLFAIKSAGAYGFCMASNYNSRGLPKEVLVSGEEFWVV
jgi:diaminopimelate decarboxylase